jgi:biopolymer transport protein ExbD
MPRVKLPRKSTNIDMTAMCDVAFLLLTFFMLATKFKPPEAIQVKPPYSVASESIKDKNTVLVQISNEGKVFFSINERKDRMAYINAFNTAQNLNLSEEQKKAFVESEGIGVPLNQLKGYLSLTSDELKNFKPTGIPCADTTGGELKDWIRQAVTFYTGQDANLMIKADNASKYPVFRYVIEAFKKNEQFKFKLLTSPEGVPVGSALYLNNQKGPAK